jgi:predicted RNase H-like nuclease
MPLMYHHSVRVAGVDGARRGWVVAGDDGSVELVHSLDDVFADARAGRLAAVAIDMPVGLPARPGERRACDVAARRLLGPRRSSVFPAPARCFLGAATFAAVSGMPVQAFHLLPRIAEVDRLVDPALQDVVVESHPELAFVRLNGGAVMRTAKRTPEGIAQRAALLGLAAAPTAPRGARTDDVLDALALVHTARSIAAGVAERLGNPAASDERGLRMEIAW